MSSKDNIQEVMLRYLNGESSAAETEQLHQWLKESAANQSEFEMVGKLWTDSGVAAVRSFDTEKAWQKLHVQLETGKAKLVPLFSWKKAVAIAAAVVLLAGAFYFYSQPAQIEWKETVARDANKDLQLPDGSFITLRKGSRLSVPENFGKDGRQVRLEGEAFFQVRHDDRSSFSITTGRSFVRDIGTSFLVQSIDSLEQVTVMEGKVSFAARGNKEKTLELEAGQSAVLKNEQPERRMVASSNLLAWKTRVLLFDNTPLSQVAEDLRHYYAVTVHLPAALSPIGVTAQFKNESLTQVVEELHLFTGLNFRLEGNALFISKEKH